MKNYKVGIIDYRMGNLFSVLRACEQAGLLPCLISDGQDLNKFDALILPGVGAFGEAMNNLKKLDLVEPIKAFIAGGKPFLGICLGLQLLLEESEEFGRHAGLGVFKGKVLRFPEIKKNGDRIKVPQVGWNQLHQPKADAARWEDSLLGGIPAGAYMYFVHSYYVRPEEQRVVCSTSIYEEFEFCSSLASGNVFACQFHPEKSAQKGLRIYQNLVNKIERG